jgi:SHS family lactate transporter-like MFS transporter
LQTLENCTTQLTDCFQLLQGITITLMLRSVGALIFGAISDRYGRKWVMVSTLVLFIVLELATGFTRTLSEFIAVRALYGIAMWVVHPNG